MKLPSNIALVLQLHNWETQPDGSHLRAGVTLYINPLPNGDYAVEMKKMSNHWVSMVTSDEIHEIIRTAKPIRRKP